MPKQTTQNKQTKQTKRAAKRTNPSPKHSSSRGSTPMLSTFGFGKKTPPQQESTQSKSAAKNCFAPLRSDNPNDKDYSSDEEDNMHITTTNSNSQDEEDEEEEMEEVNIYDPPYEEPEEPQAGLRHESEPTPRLLEKDLARARDKDSDDSDDEEDNIAVTEVRPSQNKLKVSFGANSVKEIPLSGKKRASRGTPAKNKATKLTKTSRPTARSNTNQTNTPNQRNILNPYRNTP
jgi:hypothetical protein